MALKGTWARTAPLVHKSSVHTRWTSQLAAEDEELCLVLPIHNGAHAGSTT